MKKMLMAALVALAIPVAIATTVPATAQAGFMDKYDAADEVERVAGNRYRLDPFVSCRKIGGSTFTCSISDFKGSCSYSGRAGVRRYSSYTYRVTSIRISKSCF